MVEFESAGFSPRNLLILQVGSLGLRSSWRNEAAIGFLGFDEEVGGSSHLERFLFILNR